MPFAAGGSNDLMARLVGEGLGKRLGQPFVHAQSARRQHQHRHAAGGEVGARRLHAGDGSIGLAANPSLYRQLAFDPLRDLAPITLDCNSPSVLVVPPSLPVNNVAELVAYLKAHPGELNYGSYGVGSSPHLGAELFQLDTGTNIVHVPYSGGGPAAVGVMSQQRADAVRRHPGACSV